MSLPTPTGNPLPFGPDHMFFNMRGNRAWIAKEAKEGETVEQTLDRMAAELSKFYPGFPPFDWRVKSDPLFAWAVDANGELHANRMTCENL